MARATGDFSVIHYRPSKNIKAAIKAYAEVHGVPLNIALEELLQIAASLTGQEGAIVAARAAAYIQTRAWLFRRINLALSDIKAELEITQPDEATPEIAQAAIPLDPSDPIA